MIFEFPLQLIIFLIPSLIYIIIKKRKKEPWDIILSKIGFQSPQTIFYSYAILSLLILSVFGYVAFQAIPQETLQSPNVNINAYTGLKPNPTTFIKILFHEGFYIALGEEIFFRGLLGGYLNRRYRFQIGNIFQSIIFLLPHLLLLLISSSFWPIILVQFLAGWLLGWLRYRSESILPGWFVHSIINTLGAIALLR